MTIKPLFQIKIIANKLKLNFYLKVHPLQIQLSTYYIYIDTFITKAFSQC